MHVTLDENENVASVFWLGGRIVIKLNSGETITLSRQTAEALADKLRKTLSVYIH